MKVIRSVVSGSEKFVGCKQVAVLFKL